MARPHVLLISREGDVGALYGEWFARTAGLRTTCAATVEDARAVLRASETDVVLFDLTRFRQWDECACLALGQQAPPVVVLTGWVAGDGRFRQRAFASGCAAFVAKPCHPRVLVAVLRRVLDGERHIAIA